jgi:hypothetical protein
MNLYTMAAEMFHVGDNPCPISFIDILVILAGGNEISDLAPLDSGPCPSLCRPSSTYLPPES